MYPVFRECTNLPACLSAWVFFYTLAVHGVVPGSPSYRNRSLLFRCVVRFLVVFDFCAADKHDTFFLSFSFYPCNIINTQSPRPSLLGAYNTRRNCTRFIIIMYSFLLITRGPVVVFSTAIVPPGYTYNNNIVQYR